MFLLISNLIFPVFYPTHHEEQMFLLSEQAFGGPKED